MANYKYCASSLFVIVAILFTASNPIGANAQLQIPGVQGLLVSGSLCCTPTGNCPGQGLGGVSVSLNCTTILGANVQVANGTTSATGTFNITVSNIAGILVGFPSVPCVVVVQLPINETICPVLNATNTILGSAVTSVGTVQSFLFGLLQRLEIAGFYRVAF